jgi:CDP-diacylglycerol--glycerol-3-phosphate 3-phosphatidyltransferase
MKVVDAAGRNWSVNGGKGIRLNEWFKEGWTYHAKGSFSSWPPKSPVNNQLLRPGIWLSPTPDSAPILSLFGSTNLNSRSSHLDTELSFVMMTSSDILRHKLREEVKALRQWAVSWKGHERRIPWTTKVMAGIVGGML